METLTEACRKEAQESGRQVVSAGQRLEEAVLLLPQIAHRSAEMVEQARAYSGLSEEAVEGMTGIRRAIATTSTHLKHIDRLGKSLGSMSLELGESVKVFTVRAA